MKTNTLRKVHNAKNHLVDRSYKRRRTSGAENDPYTLSRMTVEEIKEAWDRLPKGEYADEILRRSRASSI